jgi:hypothetical protein
MLQSYKQRWIDSLRSGAYNENRLTYKCLRKIFLKQDFFSPIGVLCDILYKDGWIKENNHRYSWCGYFYCPAIDLLAKAELSKGALDDIMRMTSDGLQFEDIAEFIEEYISSNG